MPWESWARYSKIFSVLQYSSIFKKAVFLSHLVSRKWNSFGEGSALWEIHWHTWKVLITQLHVTQCMELTQSHQGRTRSFLKIFYIISVATLEWTQLWTICPVVLHFQDGYDDFNFCPSQKSSKSFLCGKIQSKSLDCSHWLCQCWLLLPFRKNGSAAILISLHS